MTAGASSGHMFIQGQMSLRESFTTAYGINVAGNNVVTATFMSLLLKSADPRLIFVTGMSHMTRAAEMYFPTPPLPAGWPKEVSWETIGYRCSKTALNILMLDWNHKLKAVRVYSVSTVSRQRCDSQLFGVDDRTASRYGASTLDSWRPT